MRNFFRAVVLFLIAYAVVIGPLLENLADLRGPRLGDFFVTVYTAAPVAAWFFGGLVTGALFWPPASGARVAGHVLSAYIGWVAFSAVVAVAARGDAFVTFDRPFLAAAATVPGVFAPLGLVIGRLMFGTRKDEE